MIRKTKIFTVVALCMCLVLMFAACTTNKPEEKPSVVTVNFVDYDGTLYTMNPGAVGDYRRPTYGVLTIENGRADCAVFVLE